MNKIQVNIKRLYPDAFIPNYKLAGDAGFDLVAASDVVVEPGQTVLVPTGIAIALPEGKEMQVRPRSGLSLKTKLRLSNAPGTIDAGYRGEIGVIVDNIASPEYYVNESGAIRVKMSDQLLLIDGKTFVEVPNGEEYIAGSYIIRKGDRIAQGVVGSFDTVEWNEVEELDETERGSGGYGSTGTKA